ncbi:hypothetical protein OFL29_34205, partial [Pseudomonas aeruginosa]|nr:hypothetical protein [Pseudomonas aeruginosa]
MSNDVCGYIKYDSVYPESDLLEYLSKSELGVFRVPKEHLYNYPEEFLPSRPLKNSASTAPTRPVWRFFKRFGL